MALFYFHMSIKPMRPCRHPGCRELVSNGYCEQHKPKPAARAESAAWHDLYLLPVWKDKLRPAQLAREPFCRECWRSRRARVRATEVDHVVPHRGDLQLFLDPENLQSLCHRCHSAKTMRELNSRKNKKKF